MKKKRFSEEQIIAVLKESEGGLVSSGAYPRQEISLCEEEDDMGMAGIAELSTLGRFADQGSTHDNRSRADREETERVSR